MNRDRISRVRFTGSFFSLMFAIAFMAAILTSLVSQDRAALAEEEIDKIKGHAPVTVDEARGRAKILHETLHGALQVMHRDFFDEDEGSKIPSRSLEDVFKEIKRSYGVELRWMAVDTVPMSVHNKPKSEFDHEAVDAMLKGKTEFESVKGDVYQRAAQIRLASQCLKCHSPNRTSNEDRSAALVISIPIKKQ